MPILKWDGLLWSPVASGTQETLLSIWGFDKNNIWVGASAGNSDPPPIANIHRWDGSNWITQGSGGGTIAAIWGSSPDNLWAVGDSVLKYSNGRWDIALQGARTGGAPAFAGIWGADADHIWIVGRQGAIMQWDGSAWAHQPLFTMHDFQAIWGIGTNDLWAVSTNFRTALRSVGTVWRASDGANWQAQESDASIIFLSISGSSPCNVWAAGVGGAILHGQVP